MKGPQKQNINQNHQCPICLDVYFKPVQIKRCKHIFCDNCINQAAIIRGTHQCPLCRTNFVPKDMEEMIPFFNEIKLLYPQNIHRKEVTIQERVIVRFAIGNTTKVMQVNEDNKYEWKLFVQQIQGGQPLGSIIDKVIVQLHPTFHPKIVQFNVGNKSQISLTRIGWGTFRISLTMVWKNKFNEKRTEFHHDLQFVAQSRKVVQTYLTLKK